MCRPERIWTKKRQRNTEESKAGRRKCAEWKKKVGIYMERYRGSDMNKRANES